MKFHSRETVFEYNRRAHPEFKISGIGFREFYDREIEWRTERLNKDGPSIDSKRWGGIKCMSVDLATLLMLELDRDWYFAMRPYYKVYPSIVKALCKISLSVTLNELRLTDSCILIRFPEGCEPSAGELSVSVILTRSISIGDATLLYVYPTLKNNTTGKFRDQVVLPIMGTDGSIEEEIAKRKFSSEDSDFDSHASLSNAFRMSIKIAITCFMLGNDPSIITPDVLQADIAKYESTRDQKYVDKARRRGVIGWSIGKDYETCPHYRRPHLALRHTGKGRTVPRIVPIKGTIVHRSKLTEVPTGYILPNGQEVEPHSGEQA